MEKYIKIPSINVSPEVMFFEEERPEEFRTYNAEREAVKNLWAEIIYDNRHALQAAEFTVPGDRGQTLILSPSAREGVDWQLSFFNADGTPVMHEDYYRNDSNNPNRSRLNNIGALITRLTDYSLHGRELTARIMFEERQIMDEDRYMIEMRSACISNYEGYSVFAEYDPEDPYSEVNIYLGKTENYHTRGLKNEYDDGDHSLVLVSHNKRMFSFLSSAGWVFSQQEMINKKLHTPEDYAEFANLKETVLKDFTCYRELRFSIDSSAYNTSGVPFQYPDWNIVREVGQEVAQEQSQVVVPAIAEPKPRIFIDMDGTLAKFQNIAAFEELLEEGYFANLAPHETVVEAVRTIINEHPEVEVYTLSAVLRESEYAFDEKNAWLDKYLPEVKPENRLFPWVGDSKAIEVEDATGREISERDILLDDLTTNLLDWRDNGGTGLKILTDINHTKGTWQENRVRFDRESSDLAERIVAIAKGEENVYDERPVQQPEMVAEEPLVNISNLAYDEDNYLHFTVEADGYELEGLYRVYDPANGPDMELVSIDYGGRHPIIGRQWDRIESALYDRTLERYNEIVDRINEENKEVADLEFPVHLAIESTEDYTDPTFHQDLVDDDIQNPDGSYGRTVNKYRFVTIGTEGNLVPFDNRVFNSYEEIQKAISENPNYHMINYDDMVKEAEHIITLVKSYELEEISTELNRRDPLEDVPENAYGLSRYSFDELSRAEGILIRRDPEMVQRYALVDRLNAVTEEKFGFNALPEETVTQSYILARDKRIPMENLESDVKNFFFNAVVSAKEQADLSVLAGDIAKYDIISLEESSLWKEYTESQFGYIPPSLGAVYNERFDEARVDVLYDEKEGTPYRLVLLQSEEFDFNETEHDIIYNQKMTEEEIALFARSEQEFLDYVYNMAGNAGDQPANYYGHSLSVGDNIVVLTPYGENCHRVARFGFEEISYEKAITPEQRRMAHLGMTVKEEFELLDRMYDLGNETIKENTILRLDEISNLHLAAINSAEMRGVLFNEQEKLKTINGWELQSNRFDNITFEYNEGKFTVHGDVLRESLPDRSAFNAYEHGVSNISAGVKLQELIDKRFEEAENGFLLEEVMQELNNRNISMESDKVFESFNEYFTHSRSRNADDIADFIENGINEERNFSLREQAKEELIDRIVNYMSESERSSELLGYMVESYALLDARPTNGITRRMEIGDVIENNDEQLIYDAFEAFRDDWYDNLSEDELLEQAEIMEDLLDVEKYIERYIAEKEVKPDISREQSAEEMKARPENIFDADTQVIVNPVNLVGVMGAGLAKEYRDRYPEMFERYREFCNNGSFKEGQLYLYKAEDKWILNFPTKRHWRDASDLALIESGLKNFVETYEERGITSITFPKIGTGLGGLDWETQVEPLMHQYLDNLPIRIEVSGEVFQENRVVRNSRTTENVRDEALENLANRVDEFFFNNNYYDYVDAIGFEAEEREENKKDIFNSLTNGDTADMIKAIEEMLYDGSYDFNNEEDAKWVAETNGLIMDLRDLDRYVSDYNRKAPIALGALADRIEEFSFDNDSDGFLSRVGIDETARQAQREYITALLQSPDEELEQIVDSLRATRDRYLPVEDMTPEVNEANDLIYSIENLDQYQDFYYRNTPKNAEHPINEYVDADRQTLDAQGVSVTYGRIYVYNAVKEYEEQNNLPEYDRVIGIDETYDDKELLYMAYDRYMGQSHQNDLFMQTYLPTIGEGNSKHRIIAEVYLMHRNGMNSSQIEYALTAAAEGNPVNAVETIRNIREGFQNGLTREQLDLVIGEDEYNQRNMISFMAEGGGIDEAKALKGADIGTYYMLKENMLDHSISAEKGAAIVQAVNFIRRANDADLANKHIELPAGNAVPRFRVNDIDIISQYLVDYTLNNPDITPEQIRNIGIDFWNQNETNNIHQFVQEQYGDIDIDDRLDEISNLTYKLEDYAEDYMVNQNGPWGYWGGRIANPEKPQDYINLDITGYERDNGIVIEAAQLVIDGKVHEVRTVPAQSWERFTSVGENQPDVWFSNEVEELAEKLDLTLESDYVLYNNHGIGEHTLDEHYNLLRESGYEIMPDYSEYNAQNQENEVDNSILAGRIINFIEESEARDFYSDLLDNNDNSMVSLQGLGLLDKNEEYEDVLENVVSALNERGDNYQTIVSAVDMARTYYDNVGNEDLADDADEILHYLESSSRENEIIHFTDIANLECIAHTADEFNRANVYTFDCEIDGVSDVLKFTVQRAGDEFDYSVETENEEGNLLYKMPFEDREKLLDVLNEEAQFYRYTTELENIETSRDMVFLKEGIWDDKQFGRYSLNEEKDSQLWDLISVKEKQLDAKDLLKDADALPVPSVDNPSKGIAFDVETTGLDKQNDEILQVSILDLDGNVLFNSYVKPYWTSEWPDAMEVNGITPEMVENAPYPHEILPEIKGIVESADVLVGFNNQFDMGFLEQWGVNFENKEVYDVMREFAKVYGVWREDRGQYRWQNLGKTAEFFNYEFKAHDSLEDTKATLHCYKQMAIPEKTWEEIQLEIIQTTNPAPQERLTWVRDVSDIHDFVGGIQFGVEHNGYERGTDFTPDYTAEMMQQALETGMVTVYSSYPIEQGVFVTPSRMEAQSYAGGGVVYEKTVRTSEVAWIDEGQGQYANVLDWIQTRTERERSEQVLFENLVNELSAVETYSGLQMFKENLRNNEQFVQYGMGEENGSQLWDLIDEKETVVRVVEAVQRELKGRGREADFATISKSFTEYVDVLRNDYTPEKLANFVENREFVNNPIGDDDWFINYLDDMSVGAVYFNPDSVAGGQLVVSTYPYSLILEAQKDTETPEQFWGYLDNLSRQELVDIDSEFFPAYINEITGRGADFIGRNNESMNKLIENAEKGMDYEAAISHYRKENKINRFDIIYRQNADELIHCHKNNIPIDDFYLWTTYQSVLDEKVPYDDMKKFDKLLDVDIYDINILNIASIVEVKDMYEKFKRGESLPHREEVKEPERNEKMAKAKAKKEEKEVTKGVSVPEEKKDAKEKLNDQFKEGIKKVLDSENFKNWLDTNNQKYYKKYSFRNSILVWLQRPDASYAMTYERWKNYGHNVVRGSKGFKIFKPIYFDDFKNEKTGKKIEGSLWKSIKRGLDMRIKNNPNSDFVKYKIEPSAYAIAKNKNNLYALYLNDKEMGIYTEKDMKDFVKNKLIGEVPKKYDVETVFDIKDTVVPEYLYFKEVKPPKTPTRYKKEELVLNEDGNPIRNRKGEVKVINTPERQARFNPHLDMSVPEIDVEKANLLYDSLKRASERNGIPVFEKNRDDDSTLKGGADGYFSRAFTEENPKGYIVMPTDLEPTRRVAVMLHEMAHSELHGDLEKLAQTMGEDKIPSQMREIQAEAVAYSVASRYGIETNTSSFQYLAVYSDGFELQALEKSIRIIYDECNQLTNELKAELELVGYNMDLTRIDDNPLSKEKVETLVKPYVEYAVKRDEELIRINKELPQLVQNNSNNKAAVEVLVEQGQNVIVQATEVSFIKETVKALETATTYEQQINCVENLDAAQRRIEIQKNDFEKLSSQFIEAVQERNELKNRFVADPQNTLESMEKLQNLSPSQIEYLAKSDYVSRELSPMLRNNPEKFEELAFERASQLDKVVSKNGMFVEVGFCEQWTETPIVQSGAIMHPKVADSIIGQAEMQIRSMRNDAEKVGDYVPYSKCDLTIYQASEGHIENAYRTRVDIGDGSQANLTDFLVQTCSSEKFIESFKTATNERGAKDKILFNEVPERQEKEQEVVQETSRGRNWTMAEAKEEIKAIKEEQMAMSEQDRAGQEQDQSAKKSNRDAERE